MIINLYQDLMDGPLIFLTCLFGYILLLFTLKITGFKSKIKSSNCSNCCPNCNKSLERTRRIYIDHFKNYFTFYIFNFKKFKCKNCKWVGLRTE